MSDAGAGRSIINRALLVLLLLVEYVVWSARRRCTCTNRESRRQAFGGVVEDNAAADGSRAACNCRPKTSSVEEEEEGNAAGDDVQSRAAWWKAIFDDGAGDYNIVDESRAASSCDVTTSGVEGGTADNRRAADDCGLKTPERSAANFGSSMCVANQSHRRSRNGHMQYESSNGRVKLSEESGDNFGNVVETGTSPCTQEFSVQHDDLHGWSQQQSWRDTVAGYQDSAEELFKQHSKNSCGWSQQSCLDSVEGISGQQDDSRLDRNIVCSIQGDTGSNTGCSATLHSTAVAPMTSVDFLPRRFAEGNMIATTTSTQLGCRSGDDMDSSATEQLPARQQLDSNDDMDRCNDMNCSTTEQLLLVRQPDSNDDMEVSMAREQPSHGSDHTRSVPWWLIPGLRFLPTDQEIVLHYLKHKVLNLGLPAYHPVSEGVNVYGLDADDITLDVNNRDEELLGFFFVCKNQKRTYTNGCYYTTPAGYWKVPGRRRPARIKHDGRTIAFKTSMDYYRGRPPHGFRTPWSMFEYALNAGRHDDLRNLQQPWMNSYVVCKVLKRERASARAKLSGLLRRHFMMTKMVVQKDGAVELRATSPRRGVRVPGVLGKRKHDDLF